jgi:hypothetical protein
MTQGEDIPKGDGCDEMGSDWKKGRERKGENKRERGNERRIGSRRYR